MLDGAGASLALLLALVSESLAARERVLAGRLALELADKPESNHSRNQLAQVEAGPTVLALLKQLESAGLQASDAEAQA